VLAIFICTTVIAGSKCLIDFNQSKIIEIFYQIGPSIQPIDSRDAPGEPVMLQLIRLCLTVKIQS